MGYGIPFLFGEAEEPNMLPQSLDLYSGFAGTHEGNMIILPCVC